MPSHAKSDATSISDLVRGIRPGRRIRGMSAILLPFKTGGAIDWAGLARQIERAAGVGLRPDPIDEFYKARPEHAVLLKIKGELRGRVETR
jgi:hypothetical protein